jgi:DNA topoisomerase-1
MLQGDGSFDSEGKKEENKLDFRYHNTDKELINQFCRDIEKVFGYSPKKNSQSPSTGTKTRYYIQLPAVIGRIISIITNHLSRKWITKEENLDHYIGALVADEGHVSPSEPKIFISNTDDDILKNCKEGLKEFKIDSKVNRNQKKLYIRGRRNLEKFLEKIPLFSTRKHQALIDLLERHYRGEDKGSIKKEKEILKNIQSESRELKQIAQETGLKPPVVKYHLKSLREKEYAEKIVRGISERPRKKTYYAAQENISDTFYSEIGEKAIGEAHTSTVGSVNQIQYDGYVYDILNTQNQNFALDNRIIVHNSTRAKTVDRLYDRNYIEDKPIKVTDLGLAIIDTLEDYCSNVISEELTREFEEKMEEIREGNNTREEVLGEARDELGDILGKFKDNQKQIGAELVNTIDAERERRRTLGECQECEDGMLRMIKSNGSKFVGCSNYPDCENTYPLPNNGNIEPKGSTCDECGTPEIKVTRNKGKNYEMCIYPDCSKKDDW